MLKKLSYYGVRGIASFFLEIYLKDRKQYVNYKNVNSNEAVIKCGVPQGSILGPLLFILYINDMYKVSSILEFIIFADDTNIFCVGDKATDVICSINTELEKLTEWFKVNKLSLNVLKSNYMVFGKNRSHLPDVKLNGVTLEKVFFTKFLGVIIDYKLNWENHIQVVKQKVSRAVGAICRIKNKVNISVLLLIYNSLILPHLSYCCEIWGNTYDKRLNPLTILQKKLLKIICGLKWRDSSSKWFEKLRILKFEDLIKYQTCIHMFKANISCLPKNVQNMFNKSCEIHHYNTRNKNNFHVKSVRSEKRKMSVNITGVSLWNELPKNIKESRSLNVFKSKLKRRILIDN